MQKEEIKEVHDKKYYNKMNRDKRLAYLKEKVVCKCCDHEMMRCNVSKHRKTLKYKANMAQKNKPKDALLDTKDEIIKALTALVANLSK